MAKTGARLHDFRSLETILVQRLAAQVCRFDIMLYRIDMSYSDPMMFFYKTGSVLFGSYFNLVEKISKLFLDYLLRFCRCQCFPRNRHVVSRLIYMLSRDYTCSPEINVV